MAGEDGTRRIALEIDRERGAGRAVGGRERVEKPAGRCYVAVR
jgi:hypothetical protein